MDLTILHGVITLLKLDIGCGLNLKKPVDEWVHLDIAEGPHIEINCDFGDIPLEDGSVDEIWIGDVIEHIPVWRQVEVLKEWCRILKLGGVLNGTTPNLEGVLYQYREGKITFEWLLQNLYGDRRGFPNQHYILFTEETLATLLQGNGFSTVDFSGSPGPKEHYWWLVFVTHRV